jgi:hypothetical protein
MEPGEPPLPEQQEAGAPPGRGRSRLIAFLILGFPTLMFALAGLRAVQLAAEGEIPPELRDLDCDGKVSAAEWLRGGIDFRLRPSALAAGCDEIYAVKNDVPIVVRCPTEPRCRLARDLPGGKQRAATLR